MNGLAAAIAAVLLLATSDTPPAAQRFAGGETLDYSLQWLRLAGGAARMTIAPINGGNEYRMTSTARSSGAVGRMLRVRDEIESIVRRSNFSTIRYRKLLEEGKRHRDDTTVFDAARRTAVYRGKTFEGIPEPIFDPLSIIYHLRTVDLAAGKVHRFPVFADGKEYTVEAEALRREPVTTPAGTFACVVVQPKMQLGGIFRDDKGTLTIWYSDDERRLPVRIRSEVKIGAITATLTGVREGVGAIDPPVPPQSK